ncbi:LysE family translocator [Zavarzinia sp. CC-PAN008]|uniref:LysE family translocator n=1 Tax=Zavarzinia sp. CC-PAN008 TaxID=3243332 RepID=UPI003F7468D3
MITLELFIRALVIGFIVAAPVGPVNLVCIHRTLRHGRISGFLVGMGGAVADGLFAVVAAFGLTAISDFLLVHDHWLRLLGGAFLIILGVRTFRDVPIDRTVPGEHHDSLTRAIGGTFLLTITNPVTILGFAAVFAGAGLVSGTVALGDASIVVAGVFAGSTLWWFCLAMFIGLLHGRLGPGKLIMINRVSGVAILLFGIAALASLWLPPMALPVP